MTTTTKSGPPPVSAPSDATPPLSTGVALRRLARRVHMTAGLAIAPFLAVLCLTGLAYAVMPSIDEIVQRDLWFVDAGSGATRPVSEQVSAALANRPTATLTSVEVPVAGRSTAVVLDEPGLGEEEARAVYVDPADNAVLGEIVTVGGRTPALAWLRELHGNLHLGDVGRLYSEFAASWLAIVVLGGLVLWIGGRHRRRRTARALLVPPRTGTSQARLRSLHGALGLWLSVGLLALSVTGLTWSNFAGGRLDAAMDVLGASTPKLATEPPDVRPGVTSMSLDGALAFAEEAGIDRPLTITPPTDTVGQFKVAETADGLPIRRDSVAIDPSTGDITDRIVWAENSVLAKLTTIGVQAHGGELLGVANQAILAAVALGALVLLGTGCRMWWRNRDVRGPVPGEYRLRPRVLAGVGVVTVLVAWAIPVLGVTLGAFVLVELISRRTRRSRVKEPVPNSG